MKLILSAVFFLSSLQAFAADDPYPIAHALRLDETEFDVQVLRLRKCLARIQYQRGLAPHSLALKDAEANLQKAIADAKIIRHIRYDKPIISGE